MSLFYQLGRKAGAGTASVGHWFTALTGSPEERAKAERMIGQWMAKRCSERFPPARSPDLEARAEQIVGRLVAKLKHPPHALQLRVSHSGEAMACSLPGGHIIVTESLLAPLASDEDALAFLLAHEIAHHVRGHVRKRLLKSAGGKAVKTAMRVLQRHLVARAASTAAQKAMHHLHEGFDAGIFSPEQELEADLFAARLCKAAGFAPDAGLRLLLGWQQTHNSQHPLPPWIAEHPPLGKRLIQLKESA